MSYGCTRIYIQDIPQNCPYLDDDGNLYIDLPRKFSLEQERIAEKINQLGKLQIGGTVGFSAPRTPKNDWIFGFYTNILKLDSPAPRLFVTVIEGMYPVRQDLLQVNGSNTKEWELELIEDDEHWATLAKEKKLRSIDLGEFTLTRDNIIDRQNEKQWAPSMDPIQFPLVNYGKSHSLNQTIVADYRPHHYPFPVLKTGFCEIGFQFNCPFLESGIGSQIITYILDEGFDTDQDALDQREFLATLNGEWEKRYSSTQTESDIIIFNEEVFDYSDGYSLVDGAFAGVGVFTFKFQARARLLGNWRFEIVKYIPSLNGDEVIVSTEIRQVPAPKIHNILLETGEIDLLLGERVKVKVVHIGEAPSFFKPPRRDFITIFDHEGSFSNECIRTSFMLGDTFNMSGLIHPDYTLYDYLAGISHQLSGRFDFNETTKTLTLYTPYDVDINGEVTEGYYRINQGYKSVKPIQIKGDVLDTNARNQNRYVLLAFKDSTDSSIELLHLPKESPLYSMRVDMGENRPRGTTELKNTFFEPTRSDWCVIASGSYFCPQMLDNVDGNRSYKIAPRVLLYAGKVSMQRVGTGQNLGLIFEGVGGFTIPYAYQMLQPDKVVIGDPLSEFQLIYGDSPGDMYKKMWARILKEEYNGSVVGINAMLIQYYFSSWSFRDEYLATLEGQDFVGRLMLISDFNGCRRSQSKLALLAQLQLSDSCFEEPVFECNNNPTLTIELDGDTYNFISGGDVESDIESETIEWRYVTDENWTVGSSLSDPSGSFYVMLTQNYSDGCTQKKVIKFVDACGNSPELNLENGFDGSGNPTLIASLGGVVQSEIDTQTITYTIENLDGDGGEGEGPTDPIPYTDPIPIEPGDNGVRICVTIVVTFTDDCADFTETQCLSFFPDDEFGTPPCEWDVEYWQNVSGVNYVAAPVGWVLQNPATTDIKLIKKTNMLKRDGRWLVFKVTPTTVNHFGIDHINQRYIFGLILTGNEIEAYHCIVS